MSNFIGNGSRDGIVGGGVLLLFIGPTFCTFDTAEDEDDDDTVWVNAWVSSLDALEYDDDDTVIGGKGMIVPKLYCNNGIISRRNIACPIVKKTIHSGM